MLLLDIAELEHQVFHLKRSNNEIELAMETDDDPILKEAIVENVRAIANKEKVFFLCCDRLSFRNVLRPWNACEKNFKHFLHRTMTKWARAGAKRRMLARTMMEVAYSSERRPTGTVRRDLPYHSGQAETRLEQQSL